MSRPFLRLPNALSGSTRMELLVGLAVVLIVGALGWPIYKVMKVRAGKQVAMDTMRQLGTTLSAYAGQNDGTLPAEDAPGNESWVNIAKPEAKTAWYNALPPLAGRRAAGDLANLPDTFYSKENMLYLPSADYPKKKKYMAPLFAIAFNTKLHRKDDDAAEGPTKMADIKDPARTVALMEQGLLNEKRTLEVQSNGDYDGSPKGSAKSFVGRYSGHGFITFIDGHVDLVAARDLLTETGSFPFPPSTVVWSRSPEENPNKNAAPKAEKKE